MPNDVLTISQKGHSLLTENVRKKVLVFSPDADLAKVLLLNIEDRYQIIRVHKLEYFEQTIIEILPDLVLVDLFTFAEGIDKQFEILRRVRGVIPIIALRAYMSLSKKMNDSIESLTNKIFYKPVDVELVSYAIEDLLK